MTTTQNFPSLPSLPLAGEGTPSPRTGIAPTPVAVVAVRPRPFITLLPEIQARLGAAAALLALGAQRLALQAPAPSEAPPRQRTRDRLVFYPGGPPPAVKLAERALLRGGVFRTFGPLVLPPSLEPHRAYLEEWRQTGTSNLAQLWRDLRDQGYPGSCEAVYAWAVGRKGRRSLPPPPSAPANGSSRPVSPAGAKSRVG